MKSKITRFPALSFAVAVLLAIYEVGPSTALGQGVNYTNWNTLTNWTHTFTLATNWISIASSADGTKLAAVAYGSHIYTSTNSGAAWTQIAVPNAYWHGIASSADGNKLAAVAYSGGIYISTNSGATWSLSSAQNHPWQTVASSADGSKLAAVWSNISGNIDTSTNAGATWTQNSFVSVYWNAIASSVDGTKLAVTTFGGGIYTSTNSGGTWTQTPAPNGNWYAIASSADGAKLAAVNNFSSSAGGIYTSTNSGATWTHTGAPATNWISVASSADGTKLAAGVGSGGGIYLSTDSGATWTVVGTPGESWNFLASSADGTKLAAVSYDGIWTAQAAITSMIVFTNIVVTPANPVIAAGSNVSFTATGYFSDGTSNELAPAGGLVWSNSNSSVATLTGSGAATGLVAGATIITATCGDISGNTLLTVVVPPVISANPASATASPGGSVILSVTASGGGLSYQWQCNGTNIAGATGATLIITNVNSASIGAYTVIVSNPAGSVTSQAAIVGTTDIRMFAGVIVYGPLGSNYVIKAASDLAIDWTNWMTLTNVALPSQPYIFIDYDSPTNSKQFYRAVPQ